MLMSFNFVVMYATQAFICIVVFVGFKKYKQLVLPLKLLEWYAFISIVTDIVIDIMIQIKVHTYAIGQCFDVFELLLFSCIFYLWRTSKRNGFLIWAGFVAYLLIWIIGKFSFEPLTGWENYSGSITQILQISFGGWILLKMLKETNIVLKEDIRFWVLSGIVLYAVSTFLFFGFFTPMLASNRKLLRAIWPLNDACIIIQYYFFLRAFLCKPASIGIINKSQPTQKESPI